MLRRCLCLLCLGVTTLVSAQTVKVGFTAWDHSRWLPCREERFPKIVPFVQRQGYIENYIAPGYGEKEIVAAKDGVGVAMLMLRDFAASDVAARCETAFDRKGAPAIMFRAQRAGDITGPMYSLVLYEQGVNLWKYDGKKWAKVGASKFAVQPGVFHELRVYARGGTFAVYVNRERKLVCEDPQPLPAGEAGLWSGEGPCRFRSFQIGKLE
ncbi:MAG: hypothetical protein ABFE07_03255 [Armatimonadia bacterium]